MIEPTDKDKQDVNTAVLVLKYCSCLTMAHAELVECLIQEGKYKHSIKRRVKMLGAAADVVYKESCRVFLGEDSKICEGFGRKSWDMFLVIRDNIGFAGSEKWYQVICALSDLIEAENNKIPYRWRFLQAKYLYRAESRLRDLGYEKNQTIAIIIKNNTK